MESQFAIRAGWLSYFYQSIVLYEEDFLFIVTYLQYGNGAGKITSSFKCAATV